MMVEAVRGELRRVWAHGAGQGGAAGRCLRGRVIAQQQPGRVGLGTEGEGLGSAGLRICAALRSHALDLLENNPRVSVLVSVGRLRRGILVKVWGM